MPRIINISLKLIANLTQSWPFIPLVLIVAELLLKTTRVNKKKIIGIDLKANTEQKWHRNILGLRCVICSLCILAMVLKWLTYFFKGMITRKAARSKVAASPPPIPPLNSPTKHPGCDGCEDEGKRWLKYWNIGNIGLRFCTWLKFLLNTQHLLQEQSNCSSRELLLWQTDHNYVT